MRIRIQPATHSAGCSYLLTSFLIDDRLAIDAGALGLADPPSTLELIRDVIVTHSHIDHVATLPIYVERVYTLWRQTSRIFGHPHAIGSMRTDLFNGRLYPDLINMPDADPPFLQVAALEAEVEREIAGYGVTPVEVDHTVPCFGYLVRGDRGVAVFGGDSGPTQRIWELCRQVDAPLLAFIECSFPSRLEDFARLTGHLTPKLLAAEIDQLPDGARTVVTHIKADYYDEVVAEVQALGRDRVELGVVGREYEV